jgi:hypothetical protein
MPPAKMRIRSLLRGIFLAILLLADIAGCNGLPFSSLEPEQTTVPTRMNTAADC